jgi:hypothetical protein
MRLRTANVLAGLRAAQWRPAAMLVNPAVRLVMPTAATDERSAPSRGLRTSLRRGPPRRPSGAAVLVGARCARCGCSETSTILGLLVANYESLKCRNDVNRDESPDSSLDVSSILA